MAEPLYRRIAADLKSQIESGTLRPGDKLPSTRELVELYDVSETVIRYVMVELKAQNLVEGRPGRGVFVR